jgi:hypothetical protein
MFPDSKAMKSSLSNFNTPIAQLIPVYNFAGFIGDQVPAEADHRTLRRSAERHLRTGEIRHLGIMTKRRCLTHR